MPFFFKNLLYGWQKKQIQEHVIRGFGSTRNMLKEVSYVEDKDDGTPCILIVFSTRKALKCQANLELVRHYIARDHENGLEPFRIDITIYHVSRPFTMDNVLRCNILKCRKELHDKALVTTCSHIFCIDCASRLGLSGQRHDHRKSCPACSAQLTNPDDAVISDLNPSEDYKTSVLSGLSPNVIIECTSRALSFWAYQASQEVYYQEQFSKALTEKYSNLSVDFDKLINDANVEVSGLQSKLARKSTDPSISKNEELTQAYKEKSRKCMQIQELYDKLKRKAMLGQMQNAAEDAADTTLNASLEDGQQFEGGVQNPANHDDHAFYGQHRPAPYEHQRMSEGYRSQMTMQNPGSNWPRVMGAQTNIPITPSTHRQRLGDPTGIGLSTIPGLVTGTPRAHRRQTNTRAPLGDISSNGQPKNTRFPIVGLSSGLKVSHGGGNPDGFAASSTRPRAVQRPTPVSSTFAQRSTGGPPENILGGIRSGYSIL
ncbi:hypothetical protein GGR53DRAFT_531743 [Hypoxylon sp. FL1150]|nr:hypothetical protein GGR53DRAFT_531743 [Hypoxylon sp. FL1150]